MTNEEKREYINKSVKWIANTAFGLTGGKIRYAKAYDKLNSRFYLDHGISLTDRIKESTEPNTSVFDVLGIGELDMLVESTRGLEKMYTDVVKQKNMVM